MSKSRIPPPRKRGSTRPPQDEHGRPGDADPRAFFTHAPRGLARDLGETFLVSATSGESASTATHEAFVTEEEGGPFVVSQAATEFAEGTDASNPTESAREPFPLTAASGHR